MATRGSWGLALGGVLVASLLGPACGADQVAAPAPAPDAVGQPDAADAAADAPAFPGYVGAQCRTDADCGGDLRCLSADADDLAPGLGGPPHGLCSRECASAADCAGPLDAVCTSPFGGGPSFCLPACTPGDTPDSDAKCLGRYDLACQPALDDPGAGFCVPSCGGPADCQGRVCDLATGLCVGGVGTGLPLGADCTSGPCANGICLESAGSLFCSGFCTLGTVSCGMDPAAPSPLDAFCALSDTGLGFHDLGLCAQLCDCDGDCRHPDFVCEPAPADSPLSLSARGRRGTCTPVRFAVESLPCAADAGAPDAATDAAPPDAGPRDAGADATTDGSVDAATDARPDAAIDARPDATDAG